MTEYTTSSQAYREYMTSRERTAYWVHTHSPADAEFYSPSVPPTVLDGLVPSSPPSEADSSHSTPPKMVLRYNDGRPDVPIPRGMSSSGTSRSQTLSYGNRTRSGSSGESPSFRSRSRRHDPTSRSPEEIRILPSFGGGEVPSSSTSSRPSHSRSKSVPRSSDRHHEEVPEVPFIPPAHMQSQSPPYFNGASPSSPQGAQGHGQVSFAPPPHAWHPRNGHPKHPPAIIYAPSPNSRQPHYSPPAMFHHPPQMGPNGLIYSHSAPVPGQYPPAYPTPYPSVGSHLHSSSVNDVRMDRNRMRSLGRSTRMDPRASAESLGSEKSGSTYYVLPAHGQKVHVIAPSPEQSVVTATSTTKTPSSPYGYGFGGKKPFFQRLFNFTKLSSSVSSDGGKRLHRRHSLGGASAQHRVAVGQGR